MQTPTPTAAATSPPARERPTQQRVSAWLALSPAQQLSTAVRGNQRLTLENRRLAALNQQLRAGLARSAASELALQSHSAAADAAAAQYKQRLLAAVRAKAEQLAQAEVTFRETVKDLRWQVADARRERDVRQARVAELTAQVQQHEARAAAQQAETAQLRAQVAQLQHALEKAQSVSVQVEAVAARTPVMVTCSLEADASEQDDDEILLPDLDFLGSLEQVRQLGREREVDPDVNKTTATENSLLARDMSIAAILNSDDTNDGEDAARRPELICAGFPQCQQDLFNQAAPATEKADVAVDSQSVQCAAESAKLQNVTDMLVATMQRSFPDQESVAVLLATMDHPSVGLSVVNDEKAIASEPDAEGEADIPSGNDFDFRGNWVELQELYPTARSDGEADTGVSVSARITKKRPRDEHNSFRHRLMKRPRPLSTVVLVA